ncbi:hypothetical protein B0H12DRAFT_450161 [Mycena haematopus]|nr:hypothetical protein B0H12DRAFT_450161 [Mycena haematopus]
MAHGPRSIRGWVIADESELFFSSPLRNNRRFSLVQIQPKHTPRNPPDSTWCAPTTRASQCISCRTTRSIRGRVMVWFIRHFAEYSPSFLFAEKHQHRSTVFNPLDGTWRAPATRASRISVHFLRDNPFDPGSGDGLVCSAFC